jgi:hypothetical protein
MSEMKVMSKFEGHLEENPEPWKRILKNKGSVSGVGVYLKEWEKQEQIKQTEKEQ